MNTFMGYRRPGDRAGIRNWVGVLSVMDNVNPVTRAIVTAVQGTLAITTLFVRGQYGRDAEIAYRTLAGLGSNPNIASVLVVGLETTSTEMIADRIRSSGKAVEIIVVQDVGGTVEAVAQGTRKALALVQKATMLQREPLPLSYLTIGVECGGSDATSGICSNPTIGEVADRIVEAGGRVVISETAEFLGAEHVFAERAVSDSVRQQFLKCVTDLEQEALRRGVDIRGTNPVPDNIRGGLTTIEEKSLGAIAKAGSTPLVGVLDYAEAPTTAGMHFMETPAPAVESMTGLAGGGIQMILFATGQGNTIGSAIAPTIKITGNYKTAERLKDNIDMRVDPILTDGVSIAEMGKRLLELTISVASGQFTVSEALGQREIAISRFEPTI